MISATFIFDSGDFDADFHRLDAAIAAMAKETAGYLGEETWQDPASGRIANVYYWCDEEGLRQLMADPRHQEAKRRSGEWLAGYQVIVSRVLRSYGDGRIAHPTQAAA